MSAAVRSEIVDFLRRELIGPDPGLPAQQLNREEILRPQDPPRLRYSAGVLFPRKGFGGRCGDRDRGGSRIWKAARCPRGTQLENEETGLGDPRADARGEGEVPTDQEVNRANEYLPSAMGISALLRLPDSLKIRVTAASYTREMIPGLGRQDKDGKWQRHWFRRPIEYTLDIDCARFQNGKAAGAPIPGQERRCGYIPEAACVQPTAYPRAESGPGPDCHFYASERPDCSGSRGPAMRSAFFNAVLKSRLPQVTPVSLNTLTVSEYSLDEEEQSLRLLFSHLKTFAVGHGCAADWDGGHRGRYFPHPHRSRCRPTRSNRLCRRQIEGLDLSMLALSTPGPESIALCSPACGRISELDRRKGAGNRSPPGRTSRTPPGDTCANVARRWNACAAASRSLKPMNWWVRHSL